MGVGELNAVPDMLELTQVASYDLRENCSVEVDCKLHRCTGILHRVLPRLDNRFWSPLEGIGSWGMKPVCTASFDHINKVL